MKILVYGAGVTGSYLTHVLCATGNDVTLLARGDWRKTLEREGLTIVHHLQKKTTHDRPHIIGTLDRAHYDLAFAVMQYQQMPAILGDLARVGSLLDALGYPILPEDTMEKLHGPQGGLSYVLLRLMAKTTIGELAATDYCRSAVTELEALDKDFAAMREQKPGLPMPNWDVLRGAMPDWETLHRLYQKSKGAAQK